MPLDLFQALETIARLEQAILSWQIAYENILEQYHRLAAIHTQCPEAGILWDEEPMPEGDDVPELQPVNPTWQAVVNSICAYEKRLN